MHSKTCSEARKKQLPGAQRQPKGIARKLVLQSFTQAVGTSSTVSLWGAPKACVTAGVPKHCCVQLHQTLFADHLDVYLRWRHSF